MTGVGAFVARDIAYNVGLTYMSLLAVLLRLLARMRNKFPLEADDYWITTCVILNFGYIASVLWCMYTLFTWYIPQNQLIPLQAQFDPMATATYNSYRCLI